MKVIHKSYKFKIVPDNEQKELLAKHDRDFNASINIKKQGLKKLSGSGIESDIK